MLIRLLVAISLIFLISNSGFAQKKLACVEPVCFVVATVKQWPKPAEHGTPAEFNKYGFSIPVSFESLVSKKELQVLRTSDSGKIIFSLRNRDELDTILPSGMTVLQWAEIVFDKTPDSIFQVDVEHRNFESILIQKKVFLQDTSGVFKYKKGDIVAYRMVGEKQQPFADVVMLFNKRNDSEFIMLEFVAVKPITVDQILGGIKQE